MTEPPFPPRPPQDEETQPIDRPGAARADRGLSPVAGRLGGPRGRWISLAALTAGCAVFLFATWDRDEPRSDPASDAPPRQLAPFEPAHRPDAGPLLRDRARDPDAPALTDGPTIPALDPDADTDVPSGGGRTDRTDVQAEARRALAESARRAPVLVYSRGGAGTAPAAAGPGAVGGSAPSPVTVGDSSLDRLRRATPIARAAAARLPDRRFLITAGATLPCILETAMDSAAPGQVRCVIPRDVYSDDGAVVLLERGARVLGEYRAGLRHGQGRLFVLWTRAVTPGGVSIALASPAADALGRAGFGGEIDSHFWARFGGALMLSTVEAGAAAAGDAGVDRGEARAASSAATEALALGADITPTLRKDQGAEVSIFVAQDLDFSGVYGLETP